MDESRMFYKLGLSLRETNKYRLYILGFQAKKAPKFHDITFCTLFSHKRTDFRRFFVTLKLVRYLQLIKPDLVVITTYELLPAILVCKVFLGFKCVYDVQENYAKNVLNNRTLPLFLRFPAAAGIRLLERLGNPLIDQYLLAEKTYAPELPYIKRFTVLENKYQGEISGNPQVRLKIKEGVRFLIAGTIAEVYGVEEALKWFITLIKSQPQHRLMVIGHCPLASYTKKLFTQAAGYREINLAISDLPIPLADIDKEIKACDVWLMPYQMLSSIKGKMPTKLFEGLANHKVIMVSRNEHWQSLLEKYKAGISVDFTAEETVSQVMKKLSTHTFYTQSPGDEVLWKSEKSKLFDAVNDLLTSSGNSELHFFKSL